MFSSSAPEQVDIRMPLIWANAASGCCITKFRGMMLYSTCNRGREGKRVGMHDAAQPGAAGGYNGMAMMPNGISVVPLPVVQPCFRPWGQTIHVDSHHMNDGHDTVVLQMHAVSIHTNVVGGMTMSEPANDLAIAVAIASSYYEQPIARDIVCIGEVGESSSRFLAVHTHMNRKPCIFL